MYMIVHKIFNMREKTNVKMISNKLRTKREKFENCIWTGDFETFYFSNSFFFASKILFSGIIKRFYFNLPKDGRNAKEKI